MLTDRKIIGYADNIKALSDTPSKDGVNAEALKAKLDGRTDKEVKTNFNGLVDDLALTADGASGADNIGATAITDLDGTTVQALIESIRNKLKATTDSASGADFVNATAITDLDGTTVQALIESLKSFIDEYNTNHKLSTSTDHDNRYFTETELTSTTDGASGADKVGSTAIKSGGATTVQGQLEELKADKVETVNIISAVTTAMREDKIPNEKAIYLIMEAIGAGDMAKTVYDPTNQAKDVFAEISAEITNRTNAINNEAIARTNADSTLQTNITNEAIARTNADTLKLDKTTAAYSVKANNTGSSANATDIKLVNMVLNGFSKTADTGDIVATDTLVKALSRLENKEGAQIVSGSYTGDNTASRFINLGAPVKCVLIMAKNYYAEDHAQFASGICLKTPTFSAVTGESGFATQINTTHLCSGNGFYVGTTDKSGEYNYGPITTNPSPSIMHYCAFM